MSPADLARIARRRFCAFRGSRFLSGHCSRCLQSVQVTVEDAARSLADDYESILCTECAPRPLLDRAHFLTPRQCAALYKTRS
jgi:hypothetical protein